MSSGNFEIGEKLSMKGFNEYVKPNLEKYKIRLTDVMQYKDRKGEKILASLIGDANPSSLETAVKLSLNEAHIILKEKEKSGEDKKSAWAHQVKTYEGEILNTLGLYQDNETASKVFQNLAIEYSAKNISHILDETKNEVKNFGERFTRF